MIHRTTIFLLGFLLGWGVYASAEGPQRDYSGWHKGQAKVTPIWTLPKATAPSNMVWGTPSMPGRFRSDQFFTPDICGGCHRKIYDQWKGSMMGNAWKDPVFIAVYKSYLRRAETGPEKEETAMCPRCHTPVGYLADEPGRYLTGELSAPARSGVYCDVCHTVSSSAGVGNGAFILKPGNAAEGKGGTKFGPRRDSVSPFHRTAYSELHTRSELCGMCHDVAHAHNIMPIENTYTEWRTSPYNTGDPKTSTHCQDCHMRQTPSVAATGITARPDTPGFAAPKGMGAKHRTHVWQHWFVGGNAMVPELLGNPAWAQMARDRLSKAVVVAVKGATKPVRAGKLFRFEVRVDNVGAGHYLPTGLTYVRQMWLHVTVKGPDGRVLYESGGLDRDGNLGPDAVIYKTVLGEGGKERKPTFFLPAAVQVLSDKRIRPKGYSVEHYAFVVPEDVRGEIVIRVVVRYRSAPQFLVNKLLGKDAPVLPVFDMAQTVRKVALR
ncbi:MAG: cytochrome c554 family protein [Deltaproteobacteria bacterium]|nr:cytochrome c554 family protein [Deltaproteobacteria bacterium]